MDPLLAPHQAPAALVAAVRTSAAVLGALDLRGAPLAEIRSAINEFNRATSTLLLYVAQHTQARHVAG